jgi:hypothetical protein
MISLKDPTKTKTPRQVVNNIPFVNSNGRIYFKRAFAYHKKLDYVLDVNHKFHIGLGHFFLIQNAPYVLAAGRLSVNTLGLLSYIDNKSGHYQPNMDEFIESLDKLKVFLDFRLINTKQLEYCDEEGHRQLVYRGEMDHTKNEEIIPDNVFEVFLEKNTKEEVNYILHINDFDGKTYLENNVDIATFCSKRFPNDIKKQIKLATQHFINYGQYEDGRLV